jgi:hypothetical protein
MKLQNVYHKIILLTIQKFKFLVFYKTSIMQIQAHEIQHNIF